MKKQKAMRLSSRRKVVVILSLFAMLFSFVAVATVNTQEAEAASSSCTGAANTNIDSAKSLYFVACGWVAWDASSGQHSCEWGSSGWQCSGPDGGENNRCHSLWHSSDINVAKARYADNCAQRWDGNSGVHSCNYFADRNSWLCQGPSNR